jgi:hypothetical protein
MSSRASTPRLGCTTKRVNKLVDSVCTQCLTSPTWVPVSSARTTGSLPRASLTVVMNPARRPAASTCTAQSQPVDTGASNSSASSSAVRCNGRCWRSMRYMAKPAPQGPSTPGLSPRAGSHRRSHARRRSAGVRPRGRRLGCGSQECRAPGGGPRLSPQRRRGPRRTPRSTPAGGPAPRRNLAVPGCCPQRRAAFLGVDPKRTFVPRAPRHGAPPGTGAPFADRTTAGATSSPNRIA